MARLLGEAMARGPSAQCVGFQARRGSLHLPLRPPSSHDGPEAVAAPEPWSVFTALLAESSDYRRLLLDTKGWENWRKCY